MDINVFLAMQKWQNINWFSPRAKPLSMQSNKLDQQKKLGKKLAPEAQSS